MRTLPSLASLTILLSLQKMLNGEQQSKCSNPQSELKREMTRSITCFNFINNGVYDLAFVLGVWDNDNSVIS